MKELDLLQKYQIIVLLDVNEMSERYNSFVLVPKANGKVHLCLDPVRPNKGLIRPIYNGPSLSDILLRVAGIKYLTFIDVNSGYHNQKLDKQY